MKAVIMAGGEGRRLRPMSLGLPKPMVPLFDKPVLEYIIALLRRHGITDICITLCYRPQSVMEYFRDGAGFGVNLSYFIEDKPLGTAGSVKAAMDRLGTDDFLVLSGDAVCDLDLTGLMEFHRERKAAATLALYRHPSPLEYGLVLTDGQGRIQRFVEKPGWGQVVTNQVNTGIYVLSRRVMDFVPQNRAFDFGKDLFPLLLKEGKPLFGFEPEGYWCDMGNCEAYLQCAADALSGKVRLDLPPSQPVPEGASQIPPCWIGPGAEIATGALIGPHAVVGAGSKIGGGSLVQRSVLWAGAAVGEKTTLYGAILCRGAEVRRGAVLHEGTVLGENALAEENITLAEGTRLWPSRIAPARGKLSFGDGGVIRGSLEEELSPENLVALGSLLGEEGRAAVGWHGGPGAEMLAQAALSGITAAGGIGLTHPMQCAAQAAWLAEKKEIPISLFVEQMGERLFLHFFGRDGLPLGGPRERVLEHALAQGEFRRTSAQRVGQVVRLETGPAAYAADAARRAVFCPTPIRRLTAAVPGDTPADQAIRRALTLLGWSVEHRWEPGIPAFAGGHGGFVLEARDEAGALLDPGQMLALAALIEMENGGGKLAVPSGATAAVDLVATGYSAQVLRLERDGEAARTLYRALPWLRDGAFAAARIAARMGVTGEKLEALAARTPRFSAWKREVPLHSSRGQVMQALLRETGVRPDGGEGIRVRRGNGWVYLTPMARRAAVRVLAEGPDLETAAELCDFFAGETARLDRDLSVGR